MKPRILLFIISLLSFALIGVALYLQHVHFMLPCPLCVLQRYAFIGVGFFCLIGAIGNAPRPGAGLGLLAALAGGGVAIRHLWVKAHPSVSCGIDVLENALNDLILAKWLPSVLQANGGCTTDYAPILGLSIPQWSLVWFIFFALATLLVLLRRN